MSKYFLVILLVTSSAVQTVTCFGLPANLMVETLDSKIPVYAGLMKTLDTTVFGSSSIININVPTLVIVVLMNLVIGSRQIGIVHLHFCFISETLLLSDLITKHWQYFGGHISTYNSFFQTAASWQKIDPELLQETKCMMFYIPRIKSAEADGF